MLGDRRQPNSSRPAKEFLAGEIIPLVAVFPSRRDRLATCFPCLVEPSTKPLLTHELVRTLALEVSQPLGFAALRDHGLSRRFVLA